MGFEKGSEGVIVYECLPHPSNINKNKIEKKKCNMKGTLVSYLDIIISLKKVPK